METKAPDDRPSTRDVWMRGLFMLLFMIAFGFGMWVLNFIAIAAIYLASVFPASTTSLSRALATLSPCGSPRSGVFSPAPLTTSPSHGDYGRRSRPHPLQSPRRAVSLDRTSSLLLSACAGCRASPS